MAIAMIVALGGFNLQVIASPFKAAATKCASTDLPGNASGCNHCDTGGAEACTCSSMPGSGMSACVCCDGPAESAPVPAKVPSRADNVNDLHLAAIIVSFAAVESASKVPFDSFASAVADTQPIYIWNCILRT